MSTGGTGYHQTSTPKGDRPPPPEPNTAKNTAEHQMIDLTRRTRKRAEALRTALEMIGAERAGGTQGEHMRAMAHNALEADDRAQGRLRATARTDHQEDE